jgi:outer membrane protein OmpA-like peptidoglycan-associated protein
MRILLTGSLVFLIWVTASSWFYVTNIKPLLGKSEDVAIEEVIVNEPSPPTVKEAPMPETLVLYFDSNKSDLKKTVDLNEHSNEIKEWINQHPETILSITGHADSQGNETYNQSLGMKRAESAMIFFTSLGISPEKIKIESKGENQPVADNSTEEGMSKNRRAEIILK